MEPTEANQLLIECEKLKSFLDHNQLVQANAVTKRIQGKLHDSVAADLKTTGGPAENHPLWKAFRGTFSIESRILSGNTKEALAEAERVSGKLR